MHPARYYREQAERARRLASMTHQSEPKDELHRMAGDFDDIAHDLEVGAVDLGPRELMLERRPTLIVKDRC